MGDVLKPQPGVEKNVTPIEAGLSPAEQKKRLQEQIKELEKAEAQQAELAKTKKQAENLEQVKIAREKETAKYLAQPPVAEFNPDENQVKTIKDRLQEDVQLRERHGQQTQEKVTGWKRFVSKWKKKGQKEKGQETEVANQEKLSQFQDLVKQLPQEAQKDGMAEYLAFVFESPEEAINLLAGPHRHDGKAWREGTLSYKSFDHIPTKETSKMEPSTRRALLANEPRRKAQVERRPAIISAMKIMERRANVEPPIEIFQQAFAEKPTEVIEEPKKVAA